MGAANKDNTTSITCSHQIPGCGLDADFWEPIEERKVMELCLTAVVVVGHTFRCQPLVGMDENDGRPPEGDNLGDD